MQDQMKNVLRLSPVICFSVHVKSRMHSSMAFWSYYRQSGSNPEMPAKSGLRKQWLAPEQPFPGTNRLMTMIKTRILRSFLPSLPSLAVASVLTFIPASSPAQTAGQDVHNAGSATKDAAKDTGHAVKKTSHNAAAKTKSGTEKGYDKTKEGGTLAVDKTKETSVKSYDKSKEGVQKVVDPSAERKSKVTDKSRETNMKAKDNAKRTEQKAKDATPQ